MKYKKTKYVNSENCFWETFYEDGENAAHLRSNPGGKVEASFWGRRRMAVQRDMLDDRYQVIAWLRVHSQGTPPKEFYDWLDTVFGEVKDTKGDLMGVYDGEDGFFLRHGSLTISYNADGRWFMQSSVDEEERDPPVKIIEGLRHVADMLERPPVEAIYINGDPIDGKIP